MEERKKMAPRKKQPREWGHVAHSSYHNWFQFQPWLTVAMLAGPGILEVPCHLDLCCCQCVLDPFISIFLGDARKDILACSSNITLVTRKRKATKGNSSQIILSEPHLQSFNQTPSSWPFIISMLLYIWASQHKGALSFQAQISALGR